MSGKGYIKKSSNFYWFLKHILGGMKFGEVWVGNNKEKWTEAHLQCCFREQVKLVFSCSVFAKSLYAVSHL